MDETLYALTNPRHSTDIFPQDSLWDQRSAPTIPDVSPRRKGMAENIVGWSETRVSRKSRNNRKRRLLSASSHLLAIGRAKGRSRAETGENRFTYASFRALRVTLAEGWSRVKQPESGDGGYGARKLPRESDGRQWSSGRDLMKLLSADY